MYTFAMLEDDLAYLKYNGAKVGSVGTTTLGRDIPYVHFGNEQGKQIIITGGIHARENVSGIVVMRQIFRLLATDTKLNGGIYLVPFVNVDGMLITERGASAAGRYGDYIYRLNGFSRDFSLWKANARGVDLNVNFDADWGNGESNVRRPAAENYIGEYADSEAEVIALEQFTLRVRPMLTVSMHAQGREIYWEYNGALPEWRRYAMAVSEMSGYRVVDGDLGSAGGYKDWCISRLHIPSLTVEVGLGNHPLAAKDIEEDIIMLRDMPNKLLEML